MDHFVKVQSWGPLGIPKKWLETKKWCGSLWQSVALLHSKFFSCIFFHIILQLLCYYFSSFSLLKWWWCQVTDKTSARWNSTVAVRLHRTIIDWFRAVICDRDLGWNKYTFWTKQIANAQAASELTGLLMWHEKSVWISFIAVKLAGKCLFRFRLYLRKSAQRY